MIYFTADAHFGYEGIIGLCGRPFENAAEMDEIMVALWNSTVSGNDTVYILGDLFYRHRDPESVLKELNGKKHLIIGNHDASWLKKIDPSKYFISVENTAKISDGKRGLILSHYPLLTWWDGDYVVHGHIHNDRSSSYWPAVKNDPKMLNAGVDINGFRPVTFDQLVINNDCFKEGLEIALEKM